MRPTKTKSPLRCLTGAAAALAGAWIAAAGFAEGASSPADSPEPPLVALGRRLFHDPAVSQTGRHACASCHDPEHGWSDPRPLSDDEDGPTRRHSQPVVDLDVAAKAGFHWDGEFDTARGLALARLGDESMVREAAKDRAKQRSRTASGSHAAKFPEGDGYSVDSATAALRPLPLPDRLALDGRYAFSFRAAFGESRVTSDRIVDAVTAFVATLRTGGNALDRHLGGDGTALSDAAKRGLDLFQGRGGCAGCHVLDRGDDGRARLTDGLHHNTGVATAQEAATRRRFEASSGAELEKMRKEIERFALQGGFRKGALFTDPGRGGRTGSDKEEGAFKTPSLRDVARRGPYMHDGSLATLEDVVRYYAKGGTPNGHLDPLIRRLELSDGEVADLVQFLGSLNGAERAGALPARTEQRQIRVTVVDPAGQPLPWLSFEVVPCGERLGAAPAAPPETIKTSGDGEASFSFPQSTHVLLRSPQFEMAGGTPIPDTSGDLEVVAAPLDRITVLVCGAGLPDAAGRVGFPDRIEGSIVGPAAQEGSGPPERFVFERARTLEGTGAIYTAPLGTERTRAQLRFEWQGGEPRSAVVDLQGGWSEPSQFARLLRTSGPRPVRR